MNAELKERLFDAMLETACREVAREQADFVPSEPEHVFSPEFEVKMRRLMRRDRRRARFNSSVKALSRVAAVFVVVAVFGLTFVVGSAGERETMKDANQSFQDGHVDISYNNPKTMDAILIPLNITYLPEGYKEIETEATLRDPSLTSLVYENGNGDQIFFFATSHIGVLASTTDTENCAVSAVGPYTVIDGSAVDKYVGVFWDDEVYFYRIVAINPETPVAELLKMAESAR
ncbi:hypothetical protein FACS1894217_11470 [Clostridia bacterium]|nr:hypothetical protein FACS1894217_11470 [Clostridia bacterium]